MPDWTRTIAAQCMNGNVFFPGLALVAPACVLNIFLKRPLLKIFVRLALFLGFVLVAVSATPLPFVYYAVLLVLLVCFWFECGRGPSKRVYWWLAVVLLQVFAMAGRELPYHWAPKIPLPKSGALFVVGDSLSMGADPPGKNWPELLGNLTKLKAHNFSFGGAKVETALSNAKRIDDDEALVILEIGGNDLLGGTPVADYEKRLGEMLSIVCRAHRQVAMIELPLPPSFNRYGIVQRALAKSHHVTLIPKRYLASVLAAPGATVDGLHLSNAGHARLAEAIGELIR
jgi:acyl-CoA thioesterase-1